MGLKPTKNLCAESLVHMLDMKEGQIGVALEKTSESEIGDIFIRPKMQYQDEPRWLRLSDNFLLKGDLQESYYPQVRIFQPTEKLVLEVTNSSY